MAMFKRLDDVLILWYLEKVGEKEGERGEGGRVISKKFPATHMGSVQLKQARQEDSMIHNINIFIWLIMLRFLLF